MKTHKIPLRNGVLMEIMILRSNEILKEKILNENLKRGKFLSQIQKFFLKAIILRIKSIKLNM